MRDPHHTKSLPAPLARGLPHEAVAHQRPGASTKSAHQGPT